MSEHKFGYKEALNHGLKMTKKYFKTIFLLMMVSLVVCLIPEVMHSFNSKDILQKNHIIDFYPDSEQAESFYTYLQDEGFINEYGFVQDRLKNFKSDEELFVPDEFLADEVQIKNFLIGHSYRLPFPKGVYYILSVLLWFLTMLLSIGLVKVSLKLSRDEKPELADLFNNPHLLIQYIFAYICYFLILIAGFLLLIIPSIIFSVMFYMYTYFIVDKGEGPLQSLKSSQRITKGSRMHLLVFGLVSFLFNLGGALCLLVGLLVTAPATCIAYAYVFDKLNEKPKDSESDKEDYPFVTE